MTKNKIFLNILDYKRLEILKNLGFTKELGMYLAGGTALALQIGHRTSVDFDFYSTKKFKKGYLIKVFKRNFPKNTKIKVLRDFDDTFEVAIEAVHLSCFHYPYKMVEKLVETENIKVASICDIAAMKLVAISQRGTKRDFIDVYYLLKKFELADIIRFAEKKFPEFDVYSGLRGLLFFKDADADRNRIRIRLFDRSLAWEKVKKTIKKSVVDYQNI